MPTYDYECDACGHSFDAFQSMSDDPLKECPSCGKNKLRRLIGGGLGVIFKGSGFYSTDSRGGSSSKKSSEATKTGDGADATSKTESKTESKPETSKGDSGAKSEKSTSKTEGAGVAG